jgi:hypothetical protein
VFKLSYKTAGIASPVTTLRLFLMQEIAEVTPQ